MPEREVRKVAAEYLRPLNQEMQSIGSATNFTHYVQQTYMPVVMPLMARSTRDRSEGVLENYLLPTFGGFSLRDLTPALDPTVLFQHGDVPAGPRIAG
jgi:hypothetical protein